MTEKDSIDFNKIEWDKIRSDELRFFFNQAVETNDILLSGINNLANKVFQLLTVAITVLTILTGFLLAIWDKIGQQTIAKALICASIGLFIVVLLLLVAVFPRTLYTGRVTPKSLFSRDIYKDPLAKHYANGIASCYKYIDLNEKIMNFRGRFLTAGMIVFFLVPLVTVILLLFVF